VRIGQALKGVAGNWAGTNRKRMLPTDEYDSSAAEASISIVAGGAAGTVAYTWAEQGQPQDGLLLVTEGHAPGSVVAVWVDSWHSSPRWMELAGTVDDAGVIRVEGAYDGGRWRITLQGGGAGSQVGLTMDNIYRGLDYRVVDASYRRSG
jgi:hypothetical protein